MHFAVKSGSLSTIPLLAICWGLYNKHKIVNDNSSIVGKWQLSLIDDASVIIYDSNDTINYVNPCKVSCSVVS
jgi:hypothetical protein